MGRHIVFSEVVKLLLDYKKVHGNFNIPVKYEVDNVRLGYLVHNIRTGNRKTTTEEKNILDTIGFVWESSGKAIPFDKVFMLLQDFKEKYGHCCVPASCQVDNIRLGHIVRSIRSGNRKTTVEEKAKLDSIGFVWRVKSDTVSFEEIFHLLENFKKEFGHCCVPITYEVDNIKLGQIVSSIRSANRRTTSKEQEMLNSIGFAWKINSSSVPFCQVFNLLQTFQKEHGHCLVPTKYKIDNVNLGSIVSSIRNGRRKTNNEEKAMLNSIGFVWKVISEAIPFEQAFTLLKEYKKTYGHCNVPMAYKVDTINLGILVNNIRYGNRKISDEQKEMLNSIGFAWKIKNIT